MTESPRWAAGWIARNAHIPDLDDDRARCVQAVHQSIARVYNLPLLVPGAWDLCFDPAWGDGVRFLLRDGLATADSDALTRMVIEAHRLSVRLEVSPFPIHTADDGSLLDKLVARVADDPDWHGTERWHLAGLAITAHPRRPDQTGHVWERHPDLAALAARAAG